MPLPWAPRLGRPSLDGQRLGERIAALPAYQVAFWPDGWECAADGSVLVRDTDAMAEARRWYALADRNHCQVRPERAMRLHGTFVPRQMLALAPRRFVSEDAASVAVKLVAGDWVRQRRKALAADAARVLQERALVWSGSRADEPRDADALSGRIRDLIDACVREHLIPGGLIAGGRHRVRVLSEDGYGLTGYRCIVSVNLDSYARRRLAEALTVALLPWNRAVVRDGRPCPLISVQARALAGLSKGSELLGAGRP